MSNHRVSLEFLKEKGFDTKEDEVIIYRIAQQKFMLGLFTLCLCCTLRVSLQVNSHKFIRQSNKMMCCGKIHHKAVTWDENPWWDFWHLMLLRSMVYLQFEKKFGFTVK